MNRALEGGGGGGAAEQRKGDQSGINRELNSGSRSRSRSAGHGRKNISVVKSDNYHLCPRIFKVDLHPRLS